MQQQLHCVLDAIAFYDFTNGRMVDAGETELVNAAYPCVPISAAFALIGSG